MACEHFPLVDELAAKRGHSEAVRQHHCRITHPSHPHHLTFRADLQSLLEHGRIIRPGDTPSPDRPRPVPYTRPARVAEVVPDPEPPPPPATARMSPEELEEWIRSKVHGVVTTGSRHWESLQVVRECDYRGGQIAGVGGGCGCTATWHCSGGLGPRRSSPFEVTVAECQECLRSFTGLPCPEP